MATGQAIAQSACAEIAISLVIAPPTAQSPHHASCVASLATGLQIARHEALRKPQPLPSPRNRHLLRQSRRRSSNQRLSGPVHMSRLIGCNQEPMFVCGVSSEIDTTMVDMALSAATTRSGSNTV
jgi:hypothetical protein